MAFVAQVHGRADGLGHQEYEDLRIVAWKKLSSEITAIESSRPHSFVLCAAAWQHKH